MASGALDGFGVGVLLPDVDERLNENHDVAMSRRSGAAIWQHLFGRTTELIQRVVASACRSPSRAGALGASTRARRRSSVQRDETLLQGQAAAAAAE